MKILLYVFSLLLPGALLWMGVYDPSLFGMKEPVISLQLFTPTLIPTVIGVLLCTIPSVPQVLKITGLCLDIGGAVAITVVGLIVLIFTMQFPITLILFGVSLPFYIVAIIQGKALLKTRL